MVRPVYVSGDRHRAVTERARVHRPTCITRQGECGCSLELIPQPTRYFINDGEVTRGEYEAAQAEYHRLRALGRAP